METFLSLEVAPEFSPSNILLHPTTCKELSLGEESSFVHVFAKNMKNTVLSSHREESINPSYIALPKASLSILDVHPGDTIRVQKVDSVVIAKKVTIAPFTTLVGLNKFLSEHLPSTQIALKSGCLFSISGSSFQVTATEPADEYCTVNSDTVIEIAQVPSQLSKGLVIESFSLKNFKKHDNLKWVHMQRCQTVKGDTKSGKTAILQGIVLFCKVYNKFTNGDSKNVTLTAAKLADLFHIPSLGLYNPKALVIKSGEQRAKLKATVGGTEYECTCKWNEKFTFVVKPAPTHKEKIRVAFNGIDASWLGKPTKGLYGDSGTIEPFGFPHLKTQFKLLREEFQKQVVGHMKELLDVTLQLRDDFLVVREDQEEPVDLLLSGNSCRRVFVTFVLFYTLASLSEQAKLFLMEEPETWLCTSTLQKVVNTLRQQAIRYKVQLVITANTTQ